MYKDIGLTISKRLLPQNVLDCYCANRQWFQNMLCDFRLKIRDAQSTSPLVLLYGSAVSGTAFMQADADFAVVFPNRTVGLSSSGESIFQEFNHNTQGPILSDLLQYINERSSSKGHSRHRVILARVPIIQYTKKEANTTLKFDLSLSAHGVENSLLIRRYMKAEPRLRLGVLFVKQWANKMKLIDPKHGWISAYSLTILYIFFMIRMGRVAEIIDELELQKNIRSSFSDLLSMGKTVDELEEFTTVLPLQECDASAVIQDVFDFFHFYADESCFDFDFGVVDIRKNGAIKSKEEWLQMFEHLDAKERWNLLGYESVMIRDPYECHNLARSVEFFRAEAIREAFRMSCSKKSRENFLHSIVNQDDASRSDPLFTKSVHGCIMSCKFVKTACEVWSLNISEPTEGAFWWNNKYSISIWETTLGVLKDPDTQNVTDTDVWEKYIAFQIKNVFKMCTVCKQPEGNEDMKVCCYCGEAVHNECSQAITLNEILHKPANVRFKDFMRACIRCVNGELPQYVSAPHKEADNARRVAMRILTLENELPVSVHQQVLHIVEKANATHDSARLIHQLKCLMRDSFQTKSSLLSLKKKRISSKGGGIGVVAAENLPKYTIIGVYPGYVDSLSGEQAKLGRIPPKYALMELNCADFYNNVFPEFQDTFTPFINEPAEDETSNCAWIQESKRVVGRLSVISVKDIKKGEELLIGYGPLYQRDYSYHYDAYAFHRVEGYENPHCYGLWYWATRDSTEAEFVAHVAYLEDKDTYMPWESLLTA